MDLNIKAKANKSKENFELIKLVTKLGWKTIAWNTVIFGKVSNKNTKPLDIVKLDTREWKECNKYRKLVVDEKQKNDKDVNQNIIQQADQVKQLNRITVILDEVIEAQSLTIGNEYLKSFDVVAAAPSNAAVFSFLCKSAEVDIISLDFSRRITFPINKKLLDQAVGRGIKFEISYSSLLNNVNTRKEILSGTKVLVQYLRGRNIILTSGSDNPNDIRGPHDVMNIAEILGLSEEQAHRAVSDNCVEVVNHAVARRLKYIPVEIMPLQDAKFRWLGKRSIAQISAEQGESRNSDGSNSDGVKDNNATEFNQGEQSSVHTHDSVEAEEDNMSSQGAVDSEGEDDGNIMF